MGWVVWVAEVSAVAGWAAVVSAGSAAAGSATAVGKEVGWVVAVVVVADWEKAGSAAVTVAAAAARVQTFVSVELRASLPVFHVPMAGCKCCLSGCTQPGMSQQCRPPC